MKKALISSFSLGAHALDNIFIERLWRSLKYEAVYLHELTDGFKAARVVQDWIDFYNTERPHSALAGQTPAEDYGAKGPVDMMDKAGALPPYAGAVAGHQGCSTRHCPKWTLTPFAIR